MFVALEPVDLRKSFSGLEGLVGERLDEEGFADNTLVVFWGGDHGMSFWPAPGF